VKEVAEVMGADEALAAGPAVAPDGEKQPCIRVLSLS